MIYDIANAILCREWNKKKNFAVIKNSKKKRNNKISFAYGKKQIDGAVN